MGSCESNEDRTAGAFDSSVAGYGEVAYDGTREKYREGRLWNFVVLQSSETIACTCEVITDSLY